MTDSNDKDGRRPGRPPFRSRSDGGAPRRFGSGPPGAGRKPAGGGGFGRRDDRPGGRDEGGREPGGFGAKRPGAKPFRPRPDGDKPFRARPEGGKPFRPRTDGERPAFRPRPDGDKPFRSRPEGDKPFRPRTDGERPAFRPRPDGDKPFRSRPEGDRSFRPRPDGDRPAFRSRPEPEGEAPAEPFELAPTPEPAEDRIAKVIARAGIASRRDAEAMIAEGRVTLNGAVLASPAVNVGPEDRITVDGEPLPLRERTRLWLFHKPRGLVTTARDPQGRQTVFEALPPDLPRVVAVGRLDINTEGLLLLTNDGGLAKVIAQPATGWTRRYRARAHGDVSQADLDRLRSGITVDGVDYGPVEATLDRVQGDNVWLTLTLREGKNREVRRVLEHVGITVNRLIRLSFGPFQLGDMEPGLVEEVRTRVLKDQLGAALAEEAGVDFESPVREPVRPFGGEAKPDRARDVQPRPRSARPAPEERSHGPRGRRDAEERPARDPAFRAKRPPVWRADADPEGERPRRPGSKRPDPRADRMAASPRAHERVGAVASQAGRKVLVERVVAREPEERPRPPRGPRPPMPKRGGGDRPWSPPAGRAGSREDRPGPARAFRPGGKPGGARPPGGGGRPGKGRPSGPPARPRGDR